MSDQTTNQAGELTSEGPTVLQHLEEVGKLLEEAGNYPGLSPVVAAVAKLHEAVQALQSRVA